MKPKEVLFMVSIVALIIGIICFIPDNPKSLELINRDSPIDWDNVVDDPSKKLEISWCGIIAHVGGKEGSWIEKNLEKKFNIEIKPYFMDGNAHAKRRPMMFCAGEVPDVIWDGDPLGMIRNVRNGFVMQLPREVILKHCPTYVKHLNKYGREAWLYSTYNGRNYGLPSFNEGAGIPRIGSWRMDWLRNVGIDKVPETIGEMEEALFRFRHNDPDRNQKEDTYGWRPDISHWSLSYSEIFCAYDILPFDLMLKDGKVVWGGVLPKCKEVLKVLRRWYANGLIHPDFAQVTPNTADKMFKNGKTGYQYPVDSCHEYDTENPNSLISIMRKLNNLPSLKIVPSAPLRNSKGKRVGRTWGGAAHIIQFSMALEKEPEKVIRILNMMEEIAKNKELYLETYYSKRGTYWEFDKDRGVVLLGKYLDDKEKASAELLGGSVFYFPSRMDKTYHYELQTEVEKEFLRNYKDEHWTLMNILGKTDVIPSAARYIKELRDFQQAAFVEIITGDKDLDYFDEFVKEWYERGGTVVLKEANEFYSQIDSIYEKVGATNKDISK